MAGKPKVGLEYSSWDVHMFNNDERFIVLIDAQGWEGFGVFFNICQKAYATNGYYYKWNDTTSAAVIARYMGGGIKSDTVNQVKNICLQIGLFNKKLFETHKILTNETMQENYMLAIEKRSKNGRIINGEYWLLKDEKTKPYIVIQKNDNSLRENEHNITENTTNKSKVKKSKENNNSFVPSADKSANDTAAEKNIFIKLQLNDKSYHNVTFDDINHYKELYPAVNVEQECRDMCGWLESNPTRRKTQSGIKSFITRWLSKAQDQGGQGYAKSVYGNNKQTSVTNQSAGVYGTGEKLL